MQSVADQYPEISKAFDHIAESLLFRLSGPDIDLLEALTNLAETVRDTDTDSDVWCIGEYGEFTLDELLVGAYWALQGWTGDGEHATNAAYSAICDIYSPGMMDGPESDGEQYVADVVDTYMHNFHENH